MRKLIKLDDCEQEFQCCITYELVKETYGCDEIYKHVVIPNLIDVDIESHDYRFIPFHIYQQIQEECFKTISEDL